MGAGNIITLLWVLVCIVVILGLAYWFTRRFAGGAMFGSFGSGGPQQKFEILARQSLGNGQALFVVRADRRCLLLGVTAENISLLTEFTEEEAESWMEDNDAEVTEERNFSSIIQSIRQKKELR